MTFGREAVLKNSRMVSGNTSMRWLERAGDDFPFYQGLPVALSVWQWLCLMAAVALGFVCLTTPLPVLVDELGLIIRAVLFPAIPLLVLRFISGPQWRNLFRRIGLADVGAMLGFALLNLVVSIMVGLLVMQFFGADTNAAVSALAGMSEGEKELFFLRSLPQLFGEEVLTVLPFLAALQLAHGPLNLSRTQAVLFAWLLSSILFGLVHLPSYNWNLLQCLLVIGSARLVLSLAYIRTKNIWVSTGAHVINDWVIFTMVLVGASVSEVP